MCTFHVGVFALACECRHGCARYGVWSVSCAGYVGHIPLECMVHACVYMWVCVCERTRECGQPSPWTQAVSKLQRERDEIRARLEGKQREATQTSEDIARVTEERDRLATELKAATAKAASAAAAAAAAAASRAPELPATLVSRGSEGLESFASLRSDIDDAESTVDFYMARACARTTCTLGYGRVGRVAPGDLFLGLCVCRPW